jgi:hypothetical protein
MVVPSATSQGNWRKVDRKANSRPIQGEFRICYRVRTTSWPWCCFIKSPARSQTLVLTDYVTGGIAVVLSRRRQSSEKASLFAWTSPSFKPFICHVAYQCQKLLRECPYSGVLSGVLIPKPASTQQGRRL